MGVMVSWSCELSSLLSSVFMRLNFAVQYVDTRPSWEHCPAGVSGLWFVSVMATDTETVSGFFQQVQFLSNESWRLSVCGTSDGCIIYIRTSISYCCLNGNSLIDVLTIARLVGVLSISMIFFFSSPEPLTRLQLTLENVATSWQNCCTSSTRFVKSHLVIYYDHSVSIPFDLDIAVLLDGK